MATSEFWQRVSETAPAADGGVADTARTPSRSAQDSAKLGILLDVLTVIGAVIVATTHRFQTGPMSGARAFYHGTLFHGRSMGVLLALLCAYTIALIVISRRLNLYTPSRVASILHEQRLSVQASLNAGLLLTGMLYLIRAEDISRTVVLVTILLVTIALSVRRLASRVLRYRRFERGLDTRNVLIVGTGPEAHALRHHLDSIGHLGYTFKGFVTAPGHDTRYSTESSDVIGSIDTLFESTRKHFVDEIFFTAPCERGLVQDVFYNARAHGVDLRVIPDLYDGLAWRSPIEYVGQFPTIPLHRGEAPEMTMLLKRALDVTFSACALLALSPLMLLIAIAVKFDSSGPVFYLSERIGKKGNVFRCIKFRTMVRDAENRRAEVAHMNERDSVLFKITNDPRITRLGHFLRKYSLDELPQFFNVLRGEMSIVGPRPPIGSEVSKYKLGHLRRLDVTPGITGLWQVQGRKDPSFDSYVSLDMAYIENWSIWLDMKIIIRTVGVVLAGTGT
jgi:exopolysaccharide biosynthesis polyprenyl glycosylphosphotransferase